MGILIMQLGGLIFALSMIWNGVKGLRGIPDKTGKQMTRTTALVLLALGVIFAGIALAAPPLFLPGR